MGGYIALNRPSKLPEPHIWTGSFTVTETMEWGEWELVRLGISDAARNFYTYFEDRDPEIDGISVRFYNEDEEAAAHGGKEYPAMMDRRDFFKLGAAASAGAVLTGRNAAGSPIYEAGAGIPQGGMVLPENPGFKTKHLVTVILGNGARKIDVIDKPGALAASDRDDEGRDGLHRGLRRDRESPRLHVHGGSERSRRAGAAPALPHLGRVHPEEERRVGDRLLDAAGGFLLPGLDLGREALQPASRVRGQLRLHEPHDEPDLLPRAEAHCGGDRGPERREGLGHTPKERKAVEDFIADALARKTWVPPSTKEPVITARSRMGMRRF